MVFLALIKAQAESEGKLSAPGTTDRVLYSHGWTVDKQTRLNQQWSQLRVDTIALKDQIEDKDSGVGCISRSLLKICQRLKVFVMAVSRHCRTPATHILVTKSK